MTSRFNRISVSKHQPLHLCVIPNQCSSHLLRVCCEHERRMDSRGSAYRLVSGGVSSSAVIAGRCAGLPSEIESAPLAHGGPARESRTPGWRTDAKPPVPTGCYNDRVPVEVCRPVYKRPIPFSFSTACRHHHGK